MNQQWMQVSEEKKNFGWLVQANVLGQLLKVVPRHGLEPWTN